MGYKVVQSKSVLSSVWCDIFALDDTKKGEKLGKYWFCDLCINFSKWFKWFYFSKIYHSYCKLSSMYLDHCDKSTFFIKTTLL